MKDRIDTISERVKSLSNSELIEMITTKAKDYTSAAINIAKEELKQRGALDKIKAQTEESGDETYERELTLRKRHQAISSLMRFGNFIGWILCVSIVFLPIGISLLYLGHIALANIETEQNTREIAFLIRDNFNIKRE